MMGIIYAILAGLFISVRSVLEKHILKQVDEFALAWCLRFFGTFFIGLFILFSGYDPSLYSEAFWGVLILGGVLNTVSVVLVLKALKVTDLSLLAPISTVTPIFVLITAPFIVGEIPTVGGLIGVFCIVGGAYTLNIKERKKGYLAPFRALVNNKGIWYMMGAVLAWSIGSSVTKIGVEASSPLLWAGSVQLLSFSILTPLVIWRGKYLVRGTISKKGLLLLPVMGVVAASATILYVYAISMILVVYASSLKKLNVIFEVIFGRVIFREHGFKERLIGVLIMLLGGVLITFS